MRTSILNITTILIFMVASSSLMANEAEVAVNLDAPFHIADTSKLDSIAVSPFGLVFRVSRLSNHSTVADFIRKPKVIPRGYTGYKVELLTATGQPLNPTDEIFTKFGGIVVERRTDDTYTYLLGDFKDKSDLESYLQKVIKPRYPNAKGVRYLNGEITDYK